MDWRCEGCTIVRDEDSIIVHNRFAEPSDFEISTDIEIIESQNVRITIELVDYVADLVQVWFLNKTQVNAEKLVHFEDFEPLLLTNEREHT